MYPSGLLRQTPVGHLGSRDGTFTPAHACMVRSPRLHRSSSVHRRCHVSRFSIRSTRKNFIKNCRFCHGEIMNMEDDDPQLSRQPLTAEHYFCHPRGREGRHTTMAYHSLMANCLRRYRDATDPPDLSLPSHRFQRPKRASHVATPALSSKCPRRIPNSQAVGKDGSDPSLPPALGPPIFYQRLDGPHYQTDPCRPGRDNANRRR